MTIEEMKKRKRELGYTYEQISKMSNVPLGTVQKIFAGVTESPRYDTIAALSQIFQNDTVSCVQEAQSIYNVKRQGGVYVGRLLCFARGTEGRADRWCDLRYVRTDIGTSTFGDGDIACIKRLYQKATWTMCSYCFSD